MRTQPSNIVFALYHPSQHAAVVRLVTSIQQQEFGIPVTYEEQPDLQDIEQFYRSRNGAFWTACEGNEVIGTIGFFQPAPGLGVIRKMFVAAHRRGAPYRIADQLLAGLEQHARQENILKLMLGTVETLKAAHRFYERHGYRPIALDALPAAFPRMSVDTVFYEKDI